MSNVVNLNKDEKSEETLEQVAGRIRKYIYDANGHDVSASRLRLRAGQELVAVRPRVEADGHKWNEWCDANIGRSREDIWKLMKLAKRAAETSSEDAIEEVNANRRARSLQDDVAPCNMEMQRYDMLVNAWNACTTEEQSRFLSVIREEYKISA